MPDKGYFLITDITGYTTFLTQSELEHAQMVIEALFDTQLKCINKPLNVSNFQGDAILCYAPVESGADGKSVDQIEQLIRQIQTNPDSRRLIVSAWNVAEVPKMKLPPCHAFFQFHVAQGRLSCQLYQRSADVFLGVPFNVASYALLVHMLAHVTNLQVGEFIHTFGDVHLYHNHFEQAQTQLARQPRPLPRLEITRHLSDLEQFTFDDFQLLDYQPHPHIKAPVARSLLAICHERRQ